MILDLILAVLEFLMMLAVLTFLNGIMAVLIYLVLPFHLVLPSNDKDEHLLLASLISGAFLILVILQRFAPEAL